MSSSCATIRTTSFSRPCGLVYQRGQLEQFAGVLVDDLGCLLDDVPDVQGARLAGTSGHVPVEGEGAGVPLAGDGGAVERGEHRGQVLAAALGRLQRVAGTVRVGRQFRGPVIDDRGDMGAVLGIQRGAAEREAVREGARIGLQGLRLVASVGEVREVVGHGARVGGHPPVLPAPGGEQRGARFAATPRVEGGGQPDAAGRGGRQGTARGGQHPAGPGRYRRRVRTPPGARGHLEPRRRVLIRPGSGGGRQRVEHARHVRARVPGGVYGGHAVPRSVSRRSAHTARASCPTSTAHLLQLNFRT
ncbi:hypothetical protein [Streptomyces sp. NPDC006668]|uniref:hypothetical protein n=1 Tax=Streptomyces sp. NPDC006668 TaxID=3156903 RepID=UPI0033EC742E